MLKKLSAIVLAFSLTLCTFCSCGDSVDSSSNAEDSSSQSDSSSSQDASSAAQEDIATVEQPEDTSNQTPEPSLTIDGKSIDTSNYIMCTVDGTDIDFDTFRFYYYYTLSTYTSTYGITMDEINDAEDGFSSFLDDVIISIEQELVSQKLARDNNIELDEEDQKTIESQLEQAKSSYNSEEEYLADLKSAYLTEDLYLKMLENVQIYTKVNDTLFSNDGKYATKRDDFRKIVKDTDEYCREIHVMIPYYSQAELDESTAEGYDDLTLSQKASAKSSAYNALDEDGQKEVQQKAKKVAEEVLEKAKNGDDFEDLIIEYGWDTGLEDPSIGYYFNKDTQGGYPEELVTEAFSLKENETSTEIIENTTYGYFIVKRLPVDMDYVEENIDAMISAYDEPNTNEVYNNAMNEMQVTYCDDWDKLTSESIT